MRDLQRFLRFAEQGEEALRRELAVDLSAEFESPFEEEVSDALVERGWTVHRQVGCSGYRLDLAIVDPDHPGRYLLGVECDGASYHSAPSARDRDKLRQEVLEGLDWTLHRIWSTDWFENREREVEELLAAVDAAMVRRDTPPVPVIEQMQSDGASELEPEPEKRLASAAPSPAIVAPDAAPPSGTLLRTEAPRARPPGSPAERVRGVLADLTAAPGSQPYAPGLTLYRAAPLTVRGDQEGFYLDSETVKVAAALREVVRVEAPILESLAARRVGEKWGFRRMKAKALARVTACSRAAHLHVTTEGKDCVLWPSEREAREYRGARVHNLGDDGAQREIGGISLAELAELLRFWIDYAGRALLARLGGDEFTVLLGGVEDHQEVEVLAKRILRALTVPVQLREQEVRLSASMGIARAPEDADEAETLLRYSDMAMFHAKNRGGRRYEFYSDSMQEMASKRLALERKIQHALENEEFELYYQPKLELATGQVKSAEALLRWRDPLQGLVGPAEFIPMAEETGAIVPIGDWVLREAVEQAVRWQEAGVPPVRVAVNVSARQLECGGDFATKVANVLEETGLDPSLLDIEITEGAMLKDEEAVIALLEDLRDQGVGLALDDFGTGYSSLSYLRRLPINTLKIDRSFIMGVESNPEEAALVESIISMAQTLNLRVVAEGVETRKQQKFLDELGCDEIQGYIFSKPLDAVATAEFLSRKRRKRARKKATRKSDRKVA